MKGPPYRTRETKSVAELSSWLSEFGDKNREHYDKGVHNKNTRLPKIQQRVKKFESLSLSSSSSSTRSDGSGTPVASPPGSNEATVTTKSRPNNPVFRDFGTGSPKYQHAGAAPPRLQLPRLHSLSSSSSSSPHLDRVHRLAAADDNFRVVSITKLPQSPPSRRTYSDSFLSWDTPNDDEEQNPFWPDNLNRVSAGTNIINMVPQASFDEGKGNGKSRKAMLPQRQDRKGLAKSGEQSSQLAAKLTLMRCKSLPWIDRTDSPPHEVASSTRRDKTAITLDNIQHGFSPSTDASFQHFAGHHEASHPTTENRFVGASKIWSEHERTFQLPSMNDKATLESVFEELELEWSLGSTIPQSHEWGPISLNQNTGSKVHSTLSSQSEVETTHSLASMFHQGSSLFPTPTADAAGPLPRLRRTDALVPSYKSSSGGSAKKSLVMQRQEQIAKLQAASRTPQLVTKRQWQRKANGSFCKRYIVVPQKSEQENPPSPL